MSTILDADTVLAVDVGSVNTRASLFDVVDGRYRLVATARALSTAGPPLFDVSEGVRIALDRIQEVTARRLVDEGETLIMPTTNQGAGVDIFVATTSAGPAVRTVVLGLMPRVSTESARRLAASTYLNVIEEIGLLDQRSTEEKIDRIIAARPDLILVAGGTDGGASESVLEMGDLVRLATELMPERRRPRIVYAGNAQLGPLFAKAFQGRAEIVQVPNVRPKLAIEDLSHARLRLGEAIAEARAAQVSGFGELDQWSGGYLMLSADAFGRVVRYLSRIYDPEKGVLGVDIGASQTTVAAAFGGDLRLSVSTDLGMGAVLATLLRETRPADILRWLPIDVPESRVRDYIYNKSLYPASIPAEKEELYIEHALAREIVRLALQRARQGWPRGKDSRSTWLLPAVEPILGSGGVLSRAPKPGLAAMTLLDAVQPTGITTLVLDPHNLSPALGATAGPVPMVTVHVLESGSFASLGTVVSPVGHARPGRRVMRIHLQRERSGEEIAGEIKMGQLAVLPLRQGEQARLTVRPERGIDVGFGGPGKAGALKVIGGAVGLIVDARGRPLSLPKDAGLRREWIARWLHELGAMQ